MKKRLLPVLLLLLSIIGTQSYSQTNVTGGIFSNTTWTKANSPYIIGDSVVIFPNVTLTIDPGVVVKFNDSETIDIRGNLYANGAAADTIIFTSNSATPYAGIYIGCIGDGGNNSFSYCKFSYADAAIDYPSLISPIAHCEFISNVVGVDFENYPGELNTCTFINNRIGTEQEDRFNSSIQGCEFTCNGTGVFASQCSILNCSFTYNNAGIDAGGGQNLIENCIVEYNVNYGIGINSDTIENCTIKYNGVGINSAGNYLVSNDISDNSTGINTSGDIGYYCNSICNNTVYNFVWESPYDMTITDNYWCSTDSASIQATIYDAHVNLSVGLVYFTPFRTTACSNVGSTLTVSPYTIADTLKVNTPSPICSGQSTILTAHGATSYSWSPSTGLKSITDSSATVDPTVTTTYTVKGRAKVCYGDILSDSVVVTVKPSPVITVSANPASYCPGGSSTLIALGANTYTWSPPINLSDTTGDTVIANPTVTATYSVTGIGSNGCSATNKVIVTINPPPKITVIPNPPAYCIGGSSTITASGALTYTWSPSTDLSATTGSSVIANPTVTTTYTVIGTGICGIDTETVVVTIATTLTITTNSPDTICYGNTVVINAKGAVNYSWSPSVDLSATTGASVTASPTATTTYTVIGSTGVGCTGQASATIIVNPKPSLTTSVVPLSYCVGGNSTLTVSGADTYTWSPSVGLNHTTGDVVIANPAVNTTYIVNGTSSYGCSALDTLEVIVNPNPIVTATANPSSFCAGSITALTATGANTYTWSPSAGLSATTGEIVAADPTVTTTYIVIGTNSSGCQGEYAVVVSVNPIPKISVTPNSTSFCSGGNATLIATGGNNYTWSPSSGLSQTTGATVIASPPATTTYYVTGTNSSGCTATDTVTVIVNSNPTVTASPNPSSYCSGAISVLTASGAATYSWSPSTDLSGTTGEIVSANPTITTTYIVVGTSSAGCEGSGNVVVTVNPTPTITAISSPSSYCIGGSSILTASGGNSYSWSPSTGLNSTTGDTITTTAGSSTTYTVTGTDMNGCVNTTMVSVIVGTTATITAAALPLSYCSGGSTTLTANGGSTYTWSPSVGLSATTGSNVTANPTLTTTYTIDGSSGAGCNGTATLTVTVNPNPAISVNPPAVVCSGDSTLLTATGALMYTWIPATGLSITTGDSVEANPTTTITYLVTGTSSLGCSSTDTDIVTLIPAPNKPTITVSTTGDSLISSASDDNHWNFNGTQIPDSTRQVLIIKKLATGWYSVTVTNPANGCSTTSDSVYYIPTGVNQLSTTNNQFSIYPNPTSGQFTIKLNGNQNGCTVEIIDILGQTVLKSPLGDLGVIDLGSQPAGLYFVYLKSDEGVEVGKVLLSK